MRVIGRVRKYDQKYIDRKNYTCRNAVFQGTKPKKEIEKSKKGYGGRNGVSL